MPNEHTIAENLQRLVDAKDDISTAITNKGVTVPQGSGLEDFASLIGSIATGAEYCELTGVTFTPSSGTLYMINIQGETYIFGIISTSSPAPQSYVLKFNYPITFVPAKTYTSEFCGGFFRYNTNATVTGATVKDVRIYPAYNQISLTIGSLLETYSRYFVMLKVIN